MSWSFRRRLTWFFIVIVIVPMVAVALVLFSLVAKSERGKSDARLSQAQTSAQALFQDAQGRAAEAGRQIGEARALSERIATGSRGAIEAELEILAERTRSERVVMTLVGKGRFAYGRDPVVAPSTTELFDDRGSKVGELEVSVLEADTFAQQIKNFSDLDALVFFRGRPIGNTLPGAENEKLPGRGEATVNGRKYRVTSFTAPAFGGGPSGVTVRLLSDEEQTQTAITNDSLVVAGLLVAFLVLAFAFALTVSRSLQAQIQRLLEAAKRLGSGEFSIEVPTEGNDEFAALGSEFNAMARQLEARLEDLQTERARLQDAIRRVGESFAKGLDRDALLEIVVQTAVDGVGADFGCASTRNAPELPLIERATVGDFKEFRKALQAVQTAVLEACEPAEATVGGIAALGHPIRNTDAGDQVLGLVTVARNSRPFTPAEKDLFHYLASQAAVSIENVDLHETVQRQAVTDELTGLFNHRRFQEVMTAEVERAKRFGSSLGLIMLDIDNFKDVNDTYGHMQGDLVLREVAKILIETSREIDEPARYGGEEMAVALPQTDLEGAYQYAERVRTRLEQTEFPILQNNKGRSKGKLKVTASFGVAAIPEKAGHDKDALVAAADAALYRAKRAGKNKTLKAK